MTRRDLLKLTTFAPALPQFLVRSANAMDHGALQKYDGNVLIVVRMIGGNDGLNAVVPIRDDAYYKGRPTIAIAKEKTLPVVGRDVALSPHLADFRWLIDQGYGAVVQNVGYKNSSRSHIRATEIWETGSVSDQAPQQGWLGRYLDQLGTPGSMAGVEFGDTLGRTLTTKAQNSRSISNPKLLIENATQFRTMPKSASPVNSLYQLRRVENELAETSRQLQKASKATGGNFAYPDSAFGQSMRWIGNMIECNCPTRLFYATMGSFESGFSFDTHTDELNAHSALYSDFSKSLRALAEHMRKTGDLKRVQLVTFSDFGRQVAENREGGTDHGDASILFAMGGRLQAGLHGDPPDILGANDGGLKAKIDFRQIYANVLDQWLKADSQHILQEKLTHFPLIA